MPTISFKRFFRASTWDLPGFSREKPGDSFRGWLWTIAHRKRMDYFRRQKKTPLAFGGTDAAVRFQEHGDVVAIPNEDAEEAANSDQLIMQQALRIIREDFSQKIWQAFWQTAINERDAPDVAEELGMSRDSVRQAKSRVLRSLAGRTCGLVACVNGSGGRRGNVSQPSELRRKSLC